MMQIEFSSFVEGDLEEIGDFIAQDSPGRAVTFVRELRVKIGTIARDPLLFQLRPDIGDEARLATMGSYAIMFRVVGETVRVERVVFGGRDLRHAFDES